MTSPLNRLWAFADGAYIDQAGCDAAFDRMHRLDGIGDRIYLWLACLAMVLLAGPSTVTEIAVVPLAVFFFVRVLNTFPVWIHAFGQPAMLAAAVLFGWLMITLLWSRDPSQGMAELNRMRWFLLVPLIYPAIEHRRVLVRALAIGLMIASVAQFVSAVPAARELFPFRHPGRVTGWWSPVVGGTIQVGAVGLFLGPALVASGRVRWFGVAGLALSLSGLLASGTRGAWIAAVALLLIAVPVLLWKGGPSVRRSAGVAIVCVCVGGGAAGYVFRGGISLRIDQAVQEIQAAQTGEYASATGARIAVMRMAFDEGFAHPFGGVGAGSVLPLAIERFGDDEPAFHLAHAHSTPAHLFVTGGVPAVLLGGWLFVVLLRNAWKSAFMHSRVGLESGLPFAVLGLVLASVFDVVLINMQVAALLAALAAVSPAYIPVECGQAKLSD
ncbi:MAG: O-antigen ligase family protein [Phycisphaerales bacterium]